MNSQEYNKQDEQIIQMLTPKVNVSPSANLKERILQAAAKQQKPRKSRLTYWLGAATSMAAVVAVAITMMLNTPAFAARRYFSNAIIAANEIKSMVMTLSVRTIANEPMDYLNPECDFVATTVKVIYDDPMLWSVEKEGGRCALYKGEENGSNNLYQWTTQPDGCFGWKSDYYGVADSEMAILLDPRQLLSVEHKAIAFKKGSRYEIVDDGHTVNVRITTMAQGDFSQSYYMLNTSLAESNTVREYSFDKKSGRLVKLRIDMILSSELQITVIDSESITYDEPLTAENLTTQDLAEIKFSDPEPAPIGDTPLKGVSARKAAKIILEAMGCWDRDILNTAMCYYADFMDKLEPTYSGLEVISIEKPVKSGLYAGYFVRCKVKLSSGKEEELILALRNDNKEHVWLLDGGI